MVALGASLAEVEGFVPDIIRGEPESREDRLVRFVGRPAVGADAADQSLGQHALEGGRDHEGLDPHVDESRDGPGGVVGVEGREDKVTRERGLDGDGRGLKIAGLTNHDAVGILTEEGTQDFGEGKADGVVHRNLHDAVDFIFHGILGGQELGIDRVDLVEAGVERGGLSRAGGARHDENAVRLFNDLQDVFVDVRRHLESLQIKLHGAPVKDTEHDALPELGRERRDAEVDRLAGDLTLDAAVLGNAALGDVQVGKDLDARGDREGEMARRRLHLVKGPVDAVADLEILLEGFEVDVAGLGLDRAVEDQVDVADNRGGVRLRRGRCRIQLFLGLDELDLGVPQLLQDIIHRCVVGAVMGRDQFLNKSARRHHLDDLAVQRESEVVECLRVQGVAQGHGEDVSRGGEGNDLMQAGHACGDQMEEGRDRLESGKINGIDPQLGGDDLGELLGGHDGLLDHDLVDFASRMDGFAEELLGGDIVEGP